MKLSWRPWHRYLGFATALSVSPAAMSCDQWLLFGAWNMGSLGNTAQSQRPAPTAADLASYISASRVAMLALADISVNKRDNGNDRNTQLDATFDLMNTNGGKWQYILFPKRDGARAPNDQWVGIAWNEHVLHKMGGPWRLDIDVNPEREAELQKKLLPRETSTVLLTHWPYATKFSAGAGKTDFIAVPVKLESNIGGPASAEVRADETVLIVAGLRKLKPDQTDTNLIILGDANILSANEAAVKVLASAGFKDCNSRDQGTQLSLSSRGKSPPVDRIFVMSEQQETRDSCPTTGNGSQPQDFKVFAAQDWMSNMTSPQFTQRLSDHMLVRTALCVMKDDD